MSGCRGAWLCLAVLIVATGSSSAQAPAKPLHIAAESPGAARRFAAADKLAADGKWTEAVEEYQRILTEVGDELVPVTANQDVQARLLCQLRLAALPAEILNRYRERIDASAAKWLAEGRARRDAQVLRRIVDEAFVSRSTDQALDLLGELAFERGDFDEAIYWWRCIVRPASDLGPPPGAKSLELTFPDPHVDIARIRAKQILAQLFGGNRAGMADELAAYRKQHGKASGDFAGRVGNLADTLQAIADRPGPLFPPAAHWTTFGGTAARTLALPPIPVRIAQALSPRQPLWHKALVRGTSVRNQMEDPESRITASDIARRLAMEPIVVDRKVLVADSHSVTAYDLLTGRPSVWYELPNDESAPSLGATAPANLRYTLTAADGLVYARLGAAALRAAAGDDANGASYLVCLSVRPDANGGHLKWAHRAGPGEIYEGTPVVRDGRLYVAITHLTDTTETTTVACYQAGSARPCWRHAVEVCQRQGKLPAERFRHHLLTLAGPNVVYCSHSGAVLALDAQTGRHAWAVRYPSRGDNVIADEPSPRDLCPCVYADALILTAPADYDRILAVDAVTGTLVWRSSPVEVVQLLGVSRDRLFFTTTTDLRAIDTTTGLIPRGWIQPDDGSVLPPFGRGFLTDDLVFWPTQNGLRVLRQLDGTPDDAWYAFIEEQGAAARLGNLVFADDCLIVAGADDLTVYAPESVRWQADQAQVQAQPQSASLRYRLALAEAALGHDAAAWDNLMRAGRLATPQDRWYAQPLGEAVRATQHQLLLRRAAGASERHSWDDATRWLSRAAAGEFTLAQRVTALSRLTDVWRAAGRPENARAAWLNARADPRFDDALPIITAVLHELGSGEKPTTSQRSQPLAALAPGQGPLTASWNKGLDIAESLLPADSSVPACRCFFTVRNNDLICRNASTGQPRWTRKLPGPPVWLGMDSQCVLAADGEAIRSLRLTDGKPCWSFMLSLWAATGRIRNGSLCLGSLSSFRLTRGRLFCLAGDRLLCAVATDSGRLIWCLTATGASVLPAFPGGRFGANYHADSNTVIVQASQGRLVILDSGTGRLLHELATSREFWSRPPQPLGDGRVCLVPDRQHIVLLDPAAGRVIWALETRMPSVTAQPPQVVGNAAALLAIIDGSELSRIDANSGRALWAEPMGSVALTADRMVIDDQAAYFPTPRALVAVALSDGHRLWDLSLPEAGSDWRAVEANGSVLAVPMHARQEMGGPWLTSSYVAAFPLELAWRDVPLLLCHAGPQSGGLRLDMSARGRNVRVQAVDDGLVVGTVGRVRAFRTSPANGEPPG